MYIYPRGWASAVIETGSSKERTREDDNERKIARLYIYIYIYGKINLLEGERGGRVCHVGDVHQCS
jgi:hypothetical protein